MKDLDESEALWRAWVEEACAAVGADASRVDIKAILTLTRQIAHGYERPMAPVGAFILGLALAQAGPDADVAEMRRALVATLPERAEGDD